MSDRGGMRHSFPARVAPALAAPVLAVALAGCGSITEAADTAQQLVDQGSAVVSVATDLAAACGVAATAWAPGVSAQDARTAIDEAVAMVDEAVAVSPDVPGVGALQEALDTAQATLAADPTSTSLGVSRGALETACSVFLLAGG